MTKFELNIFFDENSSYDEYVGGTFVVICNGVNITKHQRSPLDSIVTDHYFSLFKNWLDSIPKVLLSNKEVECYVVDDPYKFVFKKTDGNIEVVLHHYALSNKVDDFMGGKGKSIAVPLADFMDEVLQKANLFVELMLEKNPEIIKKRAFREIISKKEVADNAWGDYKQKNKQ